MPDIPLWLSFHGEPRDEVGLDEVRNRLRDLDIHYLKWWSREICVSVELPAGGDCEATLNAIVIQLECIARLIDPDGPTYRKDT